MATEKVPAKLVGKPITLHLHQMSAGLKNSRSSVDKTSDKYKEMCLSIRHKGLLEDIVVAEIDGKYEVVAGFRRFSACHEQSFMYEKQYYDLAAVSPITCKLVEVKSASDFILINLDENLHREDLKPFEIAASIWDLEDSFRAEKKRYSTDDIAKAISKSKGYTIGLSNCRKLTKEWKDAWKDGVIDVGRAIELSYKTDMEQIKIYHAFMEVKNSPELNDDEKTKKNKKGKEPKVMKREKIEKFWMDICQCTKNSGDIKIQGKFQPCTEEVRQICRTVIRTITGEMTYPLKDFDNDEDFDNMDD